MLASRTLTLTPSTPLRCWFSPITNARHTSFFVMTVTEASTSLGRIPAAAESRDARDVDRLADVTGALLEAGCGPDVKSEESH